MLKRLKSPPILNFFWFPSFPVISVTLDSLRQDLEARDARDSSRSVAPLKPAQDARLLDNSDQSVSQSIDQVLDWWQQVQPFGSS